MKLQRHTAYLLLVVSILMLGVPVVPHHHHTGGLLCMRNDEGRGGCQNRDGQADTPEHCCCHTGCITTHFFQQRPTVDTGWQHPAPAGDACFLPSLLAILPEAAPDVSRRQGHTFHYIESLHGTLIARAKGLRAPPSRG